MSDTNYQPTNGELKVAFAIGDCPGGMNASGGRSIIPRLVEETALSATYVGNVLTKLEELGWLRRQYTGRILSAVTLTEHGISYVKRAQAQANLKRLRSGPMVPGKGRSGCAASNFEKVPLGAFSEFRAVRLRQREREAARTEAAARHAALRQPAMATI